MKFSAQEEYGLRCLMAVGLVGIESSTTISEIGRREGLTEPYVAKLMMLLRKGGFIASTRGHSGGYTLARPADKIVVGEVLAVLGGRLYEADFCEKHSGQHEICSRSPGCSIRSLWNQVQNAVDSVVDHITLADILSEERAAASIELHAGTPAEIRNRTLEAKV